MNFAPNFALIHCILFAECRNLGSPTKQAHDFMHSVNIHLCISSIQCIIHRISKAIETFAIRKEKLAEKRQEGTLF